MSSLKGKKIVLAVTGSIAAYKSCYLVRALLKEGAEVFVVMSQRAQKFVSALTFQTLSQKSVLRDLFDSDNEFDHLSLAKSCDLFVVMPATANIIAKMANAICDDVVSTVFVSMQCQTLIVPAMHKEMWQNSIVQDNVSKLATFGIKFLGPVDGDLACGDKGEGRMLDELKVLEKIEYYLTEKDLLGKKILLSVGSTYESIDPLRYISNWSSGKMGRALVRELHMRGADVTVVSSKEKQFFIEGIKYVFAQTAAEMAKAMNNLIDQNEVYISTAAIADFKPSYASESKLQKNDVKLIHLELNEDILKKISSKKLDKKFIGFVLDTELSEQKILNKKQTKNLDLCIAVTSEAFMQERIHGQIYSTDNKAMVFDLSKTDLAKKIADLL